MEFGGSQLDLKKIMNVIKLKSVLPIFLFLSLLGRLDCAELRVKQGENATLECYGTKDAILVMLRWNRPNLQSHEYVFYFSDDRIQEDKQHPSFKGRVNLKDPEMKNGDFSVNLTNVVMKDSGRYECYAGYKSKKPELINSTYLKVEEPELQVKQGENATLECYGPKDAILVMLRWNQPNLQSHEYVFYFSDDQIREYKQHPSFKGRVNLKDPEMKNGDFSVNLTNVVMNDSGIYECYAGYNGKKPELINSTYLKVEEPGQTGQQSGDGGEEAGGKADERQKRGSLRLIVLSVPAVLLVAAVGFVIYRNYKNNPKTKRITKSQSPSRTAQWSCLHS